METKVPYNAYCFFCKTQWDVDLPSRSGKTVCQTCENKLLGLSRERVHFQGAILTQAKLMSVSAYDDGRTGALSVSQEGQRAWSNLRAITTNLAEILAPTTNSPIITSPKDIIKVKKDA